MYFSLWIDVHVIFFYQSICINCTHIHIWVEFFEIIFIHVLFFGFIYLFGSIVFSVNNILTLGAFGCSSFVINLCKVSWSFSSDLFQYCY